MSAVLAVTTNQGGSALGAAARKEAPTAALSHRSAAALWGMVPQGPAPIDVSVLRRTGRIQRPGVAVHRPLDLRTQEVTRRREIPLTKPARTIRDLKRVMSVAEFQKTVRRAVDVGLISSEEVPGDVDLTRSELERLFLRICRRHRLPEPEVNVRVGPFEVDFLWRDAALIVETDGFRHHGNRIAFERDRARDAELQGLGFRVLRFTFRQVKESPAAVAGAVRLVLRGAQSGVA